MIEDSCFSKILCTMYESNCWLLLWINYTFLLLLYKLQQKMHNPPDTDEYERIQSERREYVKNLKIDYEFGCYEEKRPESCQFLGVYKESIEQKFKEAYELFRDNCEKYAFPKSCWREALYMLDRRFMEKNNFNDKIDVVKAMEKLEYACTNKKDPINISCSMLSKLYYYGDENRPSNAEKAVKYMKRACELEDWQSCWALSTMYMSQDQQFLGKRHKVVEPQKSKKAQYRAQIPVDMEKAIEYGILACDNNIYQSCFNVQRIYQTGDGVPKDLDKAKEYKDKGTYLLKLEKSQETTSPFMGISNR